MKELFCIGVGFLIGAFSYSNRVEIQQWASNHAPQVCVNCGQHN